MRRERKRGRPAGDELSNVCEGFKRGSVNVLRQTGQSNRTCYIANECPCSVTVTSGIKYYLHMHKMALFSPEFFRAQLTLLSLEISLTNSSTIVERGPSRNRSWLWTMRLFITLRKSHNCAL